MKPTPYDRVRSYFIGDNIDSAVRALRSYYSQGHHYTGSAFDELITSSDPNKFTSQDLIAVSMLSVNVPPRASLGLLGGAGDELLAAIPTAASLWSNPELLDRDGHAWRLWDLVKSYDDVGPTKTSKILAAKRPNLIPVYDEHVRAALKIDKKAIWHFWQEVAENPQSSLLRTEVENARVSAGVPATVSDLRIIDVVVWMRQHGSKSPPR